MTTKTIDLNALLTPIEVKIGDKFIAVKQVNARMLQKLRSIEDVEDESAVLAVYELAKLCLPDLEPDEVYDLSPLQVRAVLSIASDKIAEVEALFPNLQTLTEQQAKPSAIPAQETPSGTSSRASRSKRAARSAK